MYGMPEYDYWHREPELFWAYRQAYLNKFEEQQEFENYKAWLNGLYNYKAFGTAYYNLKRNEGSPADEYYNKPIDFKALAEQDIREQKRIALETNLKIMLSKSKVALDKKAKQKEGK